MGLADGLDVLQSSQSFVRALKSLADPPYENGPSKVHIARQGWDSKALYVPRKADLLLEWILTRFHKEKSRQSPENPLLDPTHWTLLADILAHPDDIHIVPLITRISIPGLLSSFLVLYPTVPESSRDSLFPPILRSLAVLWPLVVQRAGIDPLSECLWTIVSVFNQICGALERDALVDVLALVFTAFRSAFDNANAAGKKKAYVALVQYQLHPWLHAMHFLPLTHPLHTQLYLLGAEILLNPDSLRTSLETNPTANTGTDIFSTLFGSSIRSDQKTHTAFLELLPRLTESYVAALRKHRSAIFAGTQPGQQVRDRLRHAAIRFVSACIVFLEHPEGREMDAPIWAARVGVLAVIEEEALFNYSENDVFADNLKGVASEAGKVLDTAGGDSNSNLVTHVLNALACLHRIEPDILTQFISQILARLATCSATTSHSSNAFLSQLISYHSKTRTLHTFTSLLLGSVASAFSFAQLPDARTMYGTLTRSPLLSLSFADELSASIQAFITPGQADAIVNTVHAALESSVSALGSHGEPARKRRKVSVSDEVGMHGNGQDESTGHDVVKFAVVARLCATALIAVLHDSARGDAAERRKTCLDRIDGLISGGLEVSSNSDKETTGKTSKKKSKKRTKPEAYSDAQWCQECFLTSLLRLWYDVFARSGSPGAGISEDGVWGAPEILDRLHDDLTRRLHDDNVHPELLLEIGRVLYARRVSPPKEDNMDEEGWPAFDAILDYIGTNLDDAVGPTPIPSAEENVTIFTGKKTALALWGLTLERHLSTVDMYASRAQLERLADLMICARSNSHDQMSTRFVLARAMACARFWEFHNVRASFLAVLDKQTVELASMDIQKWLSALVRADSKAIKALLKSSDQSWNYVEVSVEIYRFLHGFPSEYLSRSSRLELAKRALAADALLRALSRKGGPSLPILTEWQAIFRSFVVNVATQTQTKILDEIASVQDWMPYLTLSKHASTSYSETYIGSTLSLLSLIYVTGIRAASAEGKESVLINILGHFIQSVPFSDSSKHGEHLAQQSLLRFLRMLVCDFKASDFSADVQGLFRSMFTELDSSLKPAINATVNSVVASEFLESGHTIEAWQVFLSFKKWLSILPGEDTYGEMILKKTTNIMRSMDGSGISEKFRAHVLSLIIQEGQMLPEVECKHISIVAAAYVLFTKSAPATSSLCDSLAVQAIKTSSVVQFGAFLDLVAESMETCSQERAECELESLLHLSKLALQEAPERTSKISHEHAARCLRVFANRPAFTDGSSMLGNQVLDFIHSQCIERAASLKLSDTACIWSILSRLLLGSEEHEDHTLASIFQTIVSIVNALVRLRRDLTIPHLPQLSMILRQLIMALRGVRPLLATKQHHLVGSKLPKWVNPRDPLRDDEARTLARALTALTTKSVVRSHMSNDGQKAESLARPFARHAPYVLLAYIQLMNDPLSVLSVSVRRELEPGLFALCGMMGEHGRDTLMVQSLDVGGKSLLKSLWKEYEKQRYVGRG